MASRLASQFGRSAEIPAAAGAALIGRPQVGQVAWSALLAFSAALCAFVADITWHVCNEQNAGGGGAAQARRRRARGGLRPPLACRRPNRGSRANSLDRQEVGGLASSGGLAARADARRRVRRESARTAGPTTSPPSVNRCETTGSMGCGRGGTPRRPPEAARGGPMVSRGFLPAGGATGGGASSGGSYGWTSWYIWLNAPTKTLSIISRNQGCCSAPDSFHSFAILSLTASS